MSPLTSPPAGSPHAGATESMVRERGPFARIDLTSAQRSADTARCRPGTWPLPTSHRPTRPADMWLALSTGLGLSGDERPWPMPTVTLSSKTGGIAPLIRRRQVSGSQRLFFGQHSPAGKPVRCDLGTGGERFAPRGGFKVSQPPPRRGHRTGRRRYRWGDGEPLVRVPKLRPANGNTLTVAGPPTGDPW